MEKKLLKIFYWGGEYKEMITLLKSNKLSRQQIRLFLGYSGWSQEQLENEIKEKSWLMTYSRDKLVFGNDAKLVWPEAVKQLGSKYEQLKHYPLDPQMN